VRPQHAGSGTLHCCVAALDSVANRCFRILERATSAPTAVCARARQGTPARATNANAHFRRGFAYKAIGDVQAAASDLEAAKRLDPSNLALVVNYKEIRDTECVVLCPPGQEKLF